MTTDGLILRPSGTSAAQIDAYAELLGQVFGADPKFSRDAIAWRYRDNPAGQVVGADAWDGDRLAAHYVTCATEGRVDGQVIKGVLSMNTATHPDYQGRGLFTKLAQRTYELAAEAGYGYVIGVANANSTPGFLRKLDFQHVGQLQAGVLPRVPRRFANTPVQFEGAWSEALLRWRLANPAGRYHAARHGELTGIWSPTHLPFVNCGAFLDGAAAGAEPHAFEPRAATLFIGLEPRWDFSRHGFLPVPEKMRPSPLNLIWRALGHGAPAALRPDAAAINFLDFDPY